MLFIRWLTFLLVAGAPVGAGKGYLEYQDRHPSTEDAYVNANVIRISSEVGGRILALPVHDHQRVEQGELLLEIDPAPLLVAVQEAEARIAMTRQQIAVNGAAVGAAKAALVRFEAELTDARAQARRASELLAKGAVSEARFDDTRARLDQARADVERGRAELGIARETLGAPGEDNAALREATVQLAQAKLNLSYSTLVAPKAGILGELHVRPGNVVQKGQPLFALVEDGSYWVDANFKETDIENIKLGHPVRITVDMYPGRVIHGKVEAISIASGAAFSLLPPENASGNWVKITQRFPIRISVNGLPRDTTLRIGASSHVTVDVAPPSAGDIFERIFVAPPSAGNIFERIFGD